MFNKVFFTIDVEKDLHSNSYEGVSKGLPIILDILKDNKIKATFFVVGNIIEKYPEILKRTVREGHDLGIHGFTHKRFDSLSLKQKEKEIKNSINAYKKITGKKPIIFRAPQHSIDRDTINLLIKNNFKYDSSLCSGNLFLLRHLFERKTNKIEILKSFFGKSRPYMIKNLKEIPNSAPFIAIGAFQLKIYPKWLVKLILHLYRITNIPINFVMHSWDMIDIKDSWTSKHCSKSDFIKILSSFLKETKKSHKFIKMDDYL